MRETRKTIQSLENLALSVVRNIGTFTIKDVMETDMRLLMKMLDDKQERKQAEKKVMDFTQMTTDETIKALGG